MHDETIETHAFRGFKARIVGFTEEGSNDGRVGGALWCATIADACLAEFAAEVFDHK